MKRFWLILLSLGLVMAFSVSAFAVDVQMSGNFYVAGMYLNKTSLADADEIPYMIKTIESPVTRQSQSQHCFLLSETTRRNRLYRISWLETDYPL